MAVVYKRRPVEEVPVKTIARRRYVPPNRRLTINELHGVISQKMVLFGNYQIITSFGTYSSVGIVVSSLADTSYLFVVAPFTLSSCQSGTFKFIAWIFSIIDISI
jgi:hypothetical protein